MLRRAAAAAVGLAAAAAAATAATGTLSPSRPVYSAPAATASSPTAATPPALAPPSPSTGAPCAASAGGKVYLVGAGPGAADLLTLRAARLLQVADVVVMDALVGQEVLQHCAPHCQVVLMGKRGGDDGAANQHDINQALVDLCRAGKQVVRLKGGDPLLFGRAADEIRALRAAGCDYELVPGITSPFAAAAEVELMLTHKIHSSTLALATGHDPSLLNFSALAATDTVVLLMATRTLDTIVAELQAAGRSADTPVAILKNATLPSRQAWHGTLGTIVGATRGQALSPSIVIIGEAARLAPDQRPVL